MSIQEELLQAKGRRKTLSPEDVVTYARKHADSELHAAFDRRGLWDDKKAAAIARREYGRRLIHRYKVNVTRYDGKQERVRAMVSLSEERRNGHHGYSLRADVLTDDERRRKMLRDCSRDIDSILKKYADILSGSQAETLRELSAEIASGLQVTDGGVSMEHGVAAEKA